MLLPKEKVKIGKPAVEVVIATPNLYMDKKMIKLFCIDMDGTLLDDRHSLTKENIKALEIIKDNGGKIVIATGEKCYCINAIY